MAILKLSGLAARATSSQGAMPVATTTATPDAGRAFQERYASASRQISATRPPVGNDRYPKPDSSEIRAPATGQCQKPLAGPNGPIRTQVPDQKALPSVARQSLVSSRLKKRTKAMTRSRTQKRALRSIADELNIMITETDIGAVEDSITFRTDAEQWQDTEFTLVRNGCGWQLSVSTPLASDGERLRRSERALSCRFAVADLGEIELRVNQITIGAVDRRA